MTIIDLAVPSDVEIDIQDSSNVVYIGNTGVEKSVNINLDLRKIEIIKAKVIVEAEVDIFLKKLLRHSEMKYGKNINSIKEK